MCAILTASRPPASVPLSRILLREGRGVAPPQRVTAWSERENDARSLEVNGNAAGSGA